MAIYQTGGYRVKPSAVEKVKEAIREFVRYVQANEPGSQMYLAWQQKDDPTHFLHLFIFEDDAAQARHGKSEAVRRFAAPALDHAQLGQRVEGGINFDVVEVLGVPRQALPRRHVPCPVVAGPSGRRRPSACRAARRAQAGPRPLELRRRHPDADHPGGPSLQRARGDSERGLVEHQLERDHQRAHGGAEQGLDQQRDSRQLGSQA